MSVGFNITANFLGRAYSMGAQYLFVPFYVSILSVEAYGIIAFYTVILAIGSLADAGLSAAFSREVAREDDRARLMVLLATIERILLVTTLLFALLVFGGSDYIARTWLNGSPSLPTEEIAHNLRLMAFIVPLQLGISLYVAGLYGLQQQGKANLLQASYTTLRGGLVIPFLYEVPSLELFFLWQLAMSILVFVVSRIVLVKQLGFKPSAIGEYSLEALKPVLRFAGGILGITILLAINTQLDKIVVNRLFSVEEFGYYSLGWTLAQVPIALAAPVMIALFPRFAGLAATGDQASLSQLYETCSYLVVSIGAVAAFGLLFFAREALTVWLGAEHVIDPAVLVVRVMAVSALFLVLQMVPFNLCLAQGHSRTSILLGVFTTVIIVPLIVLAARRFGLAGAAMPWIVVNAAAFFVLATVAGRHFYAGRVWLWLAYVTVPVVFAAAGIVSARLAANLTNAGPVVACAWATAGASAALLVLFYMAKGRMARQFKSLAKTEPVGSL